jgi:MFS family permease
VPWGRVLPSVVTTLLAGRAVHRWGTRPTLWGSLALTGVGLPLVLQPNLATVLLGMVLIGVGTFFAQATATGFVSQAATADRGAASGIYLACYFAGGLVGTAILGQIFDLCRRNRAVARRSSTSRFFPENEPFTRVRSQRSQGRFLLPACVQNSLMYDFHLI